MVLVAAGVPVYMLSKEPFGPLFEVVLYTAVAGLILAMLLPGVRLLKANRWLLRPFGALLLLASLSVCLLATVVTVDYTMLPWIGAKRNLTVEQRREDLAYLAQEMPMAHPSLFENISEEDFYEAISDLDKRLGRLDGIQAKSEIVRMVALAEDAHTFPNIFSFSLDIHIYPLQLFSFGDRLMVVDAAREHRKTIGCELVEVCGVPVEKALQAVAPYLSAENEIGAMQRRLAAMTVAELLYAAGVAEHSDRAVFTFANQAGERFQAIIRAYNYIPVGYWSFGRTIDNSFCPAKAGNRKDNYIFEHKKDTGTIYVQFNQCYEEENISMAEFADRLAEFVDSHDFERFVVDVRNNDGGDGEMVHPLAELIAGNEKINRDGRLFVIIGRKTFSAAVMFAALLGNTTKAIFVGEPTAQGPVFFSSPNPITLPNCGMEVLVSSHLTLGSFAWDKRDRILPDIPVDYTWDDYTSGTDPCMEAILAYDHMERKREKLDEHAVGRYEGRYLVEPYHIATVSEVAGDLQISVTDFDPYGFQKIKTELYPISSTRFFTDIDGVEVVFPSSEDGPASGLTIRYGPEEIEALRISGDFFLPMELVEQGRKEELITALLGQRRDEYAARMPNLEGFLNSEGYRYLWDADHDMAIRVLELNTELFPNSYNVWDSLGEALMESGRRDLAVVNYEKSLELNPHNENARKMLRELK
jgi:hypothetical protein